MGVGMPDVKRNGGDVGPIRQHDDGSMEVQVKPLMIVVRDSALCRFIVHVPVDLALRAHHDGSDISHVLIVVAKCQLLDLAKALEVSPCAGTMGYFGATVTVQASLQALRRSAPPRNAHCLRQE